MILIMFLCITGCKLISAEIQQCIHKLPRPGWLLHAGARLQVCSIESSSITRSSRDAYTLHKLRGLYVRSVLVQTVQNSLVNKIDFYVKSQSVQCISSYLMVSVQFIFRLFNFCLFKFIYVIDTEIGVVNQIKSFYSLSVVIMDYICNPGYNFAKSAIFSFVLLFHMEWNRLISNVENERHLLSVKRDRLCPPEMII